MLSFHTIVICTIQPSLACYGCVCITVCAIYILTYTAFLGANVLVTFIAYVTVSMLMMCNTFDWKYFFQILVCKPYYYNFCNVEIIQA